jgi:endonuclease/exonuclease/phosphatase family metal-dependent hydrolase
MRTRTLAGIAVVALVGAAVPALAGGDAYTPGTSGTSGTPGVDIQPRCGVEGTGSPATLAGSTVKVGTYNVLHSQSENPDSNVDARFDQVVAAMATADADVWGLQEVTSNTQYGNVAQRIAAGLSAANDGERWEWCWSMSNPHFPGEPDVNEGGGGPLSELMAMFSNFPASGDFREGVAIVTRLDIEAARARRLTPRFYETPFCVPPDPLGCNLPALFDSRQLLWARVDAGSGAFDMSTTHLAHGLTPLSDTTKRVQVEVALRYLEEWATPGDATFFVGDFNSDAATDRYQAVLDAGFADLYLAAPGAPECNPVTHAGCTSSQREITDGQFDNTTSSRIDHVFGRSGACTLGASASAILGTNSRQISSVPERWLWPSDHLGVVTTVGCST